MNSTATPTPAIDDADAVRHGNAELLAHALGDTRERLLAQFDAYRAALGARGMAVPYTPELNPPLWELGHIGWFEEWWIGRNPLRTLGAAADPLAGRAVPLRANADALYNSSAVAHARRWRLSLPDTAHTLADVARIRERTLALLADAGDSDAALYFYRLSLFHEDMHREAWVYMAQNLGFAPGVEVIEPAAAPADAGEIAIDGGLATIGSPAGGFAFDNELQQQEVALAGYTIDAAPVTWARVVEFVEAGGYDNAKLWSPEGWAWRKRRTAPWPRYLERADDGSWWRRRFGERVALDLALPAMHLTHHEAQAWCRWAGRRLPSEFEWEHAALARGDAFHWGQVWEWTASPFMPYPGFEPHPYRDYSQPFFDGRPALRGGSFATAPRMKHRRYRNYFTAERNDLFAGFRTCAV
ncbi:MAG: selenoneine synthase SenA [Burkholderiaceae bacterium]